MSAEKTTKLRLDPDMIETGRAIFKANPQVWREIEQVIRTGQKPTPKQLADWREALGKAAADAGT